jgi:DNA repair protein RadC
MTPSLQLAPARDQLQLTHTTEVSDLELLALVLGQADGIDRAMRIMDGLGGLDALLHASVDDLRGLAGLSEQRACRLLAAAELGRRMLSLPLRRGDPLRSAHDVDARLRGRLIGLEQEELHVLGVDCQKRLVVHSRAAVGTVNRVYTCAADVFRPLVRAAAHGAIIVHNHPSGLCQPSAADVELTSRLAEAGALLGVPLVDHVVIARDGHYSFAEHQIVLGSIA